MSLTLMFTFTSAENKKFSYSANVIRDDERIIQSKPSYFWFGDADEDVDGSPYWQDDEYGQPGTTLRLNGKPINGDETPFIVVPPAIIRATPEIVMGCLGGMEYNGKSVACVVGDESPTRKLGEASPAALRALGLPVLRNGNGGLDTQEILYRIWPGIPANINGIQFVLQPH